jgi:hypothetical protein
MPSGQVGTTSWDSNALQFGGYVADSWNYTAVGAYNPTATASDAAGNVGTFKYTGTPFTITPTQLSTSITLLATSSQTAVTSLVNGQGVTIMATITYPTNAEPVAGFVAPLDTAARGGVVSAMVGYGYFNATSGTFGGSAKNPGTLIATVPMTYTGANGTWTGTYTPSSLPTLPAGALYQVVVTSSDKASPVNTGLGILSVAPSTGPATVSTGTSTMTTTAMVTTTVTQASTSIPTIAYAGMGILLVLGVIVGLIVSSRKR